MRWGPADLDQFIAIARKHGLYLIEDACQAHLAVHRGKKLGTIGNLGCFSFRTSKTICCGEGGAIVGDDYATRYKTTVLPAGDVQKGLDPSTG